MILFPVVLVCERVLFFFQAEDGIRDIGVTGVQTCALPISGGRSSISAAGPAGTPSGSPRAARGSRAWTSRRDRKSVVQGKSVDLGGRRIIKKKTITWDKDEDTLAHQ